MFMAAQIALALAAFLCSLVAGFLLAFAVVVMPGIRNLADREFVRAFQEIDGVIQRGHPLFGLVWLGSVIVMVSGLALGVGQVVGFDRMLLALAGAVYLLGVQLPTFIVDIPLNNELQALDVDVANEAACRSARARFEPRWNRWNTSRTALAALTSAMLILLLIRI
jgi:uncharacterized membrane protein